MTSVWANIHVTVGSFPSIFVGLTIRIGNAAKEYVYGLSSFGVRHTLYTILDTQAQISANCGHRIYYDSHTLDYGLFKKPSDIKKYHLFEPIFWQGEPYVIGLDLFGVACI